MERVRQAGPYSIFGNSMILCDMLAEFRFDSAPELKFPIWASFPSLPMELGNESVVGKIASFVGIPTEVDYRTLAKNSVEGPRFQVLVDALEEPMEGLPIKLQSGLVYIQPIKFEYYPKMCSK